MANTSSFYLYHDTYGVFFLKLVALFGEHDGGLERLGLLEVHERVGDDDDGVANLHLACCGSIEADASRSTLTLDDVGLEALAIVVVYNLHLLASNHVGGVHQVLVDGYAAQVFQVGVGNRYAVQLAFEYLYLHDLLGFNLLVIL